MVGALKTGCPRWKEGGLNNQRTLVQEREGGLGIGVSQKVQWILPQGHGPLALPLLLPPVLLLACLLPVSFLGSEVFVHSGGRCIPSILNSTRSLVGAWWASVREWHARQGHP